MSGRFVLLCDCLRCQELGFIFRVETTGHDISSARSIARSEIHPEESRWTGDGEHDYAPGHEQADFDGTNRELVRVEERAQLIRTVMLDKFRPPVLPSRRVSWQDLSENDREYYREKARNELQADRKRVRGLR